MDDLDIEVEGHSERLFTESRDHWYNPDFLTLLAQRWGLSEHRSLLDVGAGLCHWSRLLLPFLKDKPEITAVDADPKWAAGNSEITASFLKEGASINFMQADAHELPFEDDSFDVVTCQTLLIHLHSPEKALSEMKRVVKPGGIVICAEPSNRAQFLLQDSVNRNDDIETILERVKMGLAQEKIKLMDKEGDNSYGDLLTGVMNRLGFNEIQTYLNDKVSAIFPPYETRGQQATINNYLGWKDDDSLFEVEKKHLTHLNEHDFLGFIEAYNGRFGHDRVLTALKSHSYYNGGAALIYLVSGRK